MAYTTVRHAEFGFAEQLVNLFGDLRDALVQRYAFNRTYSALSKLTDRELFDIGLQRSEIAEAAAKAVK